MTNFFNPFWCMRREQAEAMVRRQPVPVEVDQQVELTWQWTSPLPAEKRGLPDFLFYELKSVKGR